MPDILDGGFDSQTLTDAADPLVIDRRIVITRQIVSNAAVTLVWACCVDFLYLICDAPVLYSAGAEFPRAPLVIASPGDMEYPAQCFHRITLFLGAEADRLILTLILKLPQAFPLSKSLTFFYKSFSIFSK